MKSIDLANLTETVQNSFKNVEHPRNKYLLEQLVKHLHAFAQETQLTHDEWRMGLQFLHDAAKITTDTRSEFSLTSDVFGLSSMVDLLASKQGTTPGSVLGPFHARGSPWMTTPVNLRGSNPGELVILRGSVKTETHQPIPEATIDFWQNADNGLYWQQDPTQPTDNLRCQFKVDAQGAWEVATIRARPYTIPLDGPVWNDLVQPAGRDGWRAAHVHMIVSAPGHRTLVTELFDAQDPYLDTDAVFGVRQALIGHYHPETDAAAAARLGLAGDQCPVMRVELVLSPLP